MAINATHPDYDFTLPEWIRARDVLAGEDADHTEKIFTEGTKGTRAPNNESAQARRG